MDPVELAQRLQAVGRRGAGTDAERRAARLLQRELKRLGRREARLWTTWVRPHWAFAHAMIAVLAVVGSVVSVEAPVVGLALAGAALALFVGDLSGRAPVLRRLTYERATQDVVARDPRADAPVRLVICAPLDVPRAGVLDAGRPARAVASLRRRLGGRLPGRFGITLAALLGLVACIALRVGEADGDWLGPVQLVPTAALLLAVGVFVDAGTAQVPRRGSGSAAAAAVAVALVAELTRRPPRALAVDVLLHGAAGPHALGMRRWVREERRAGRRPEQVAVLAIEPCASGPVAHWSHEGLVLPLALHPTMRAHAATRSPATRSPTASAARAARAAGWPALRIGTTGCAPADDPDLDPGALEATLELVLTVVGRLDAELAPAAPAPARQPASAATTAPRPGSRHARRAAAAAARGASSRRER